MTRVLPVGWAIGRREWRERKPPIGDLVVCLLGVLLASFVAAGASQTAERVKGLLSFAV